MHGKSKTEIFCFLIFPLYFSEFPLYVLRVQRHPGNLEQNYFTRYFHLSKCSFEFNNLFDPLIWIPRPGSKICWIRRIKQHQFLAFSPRQIFNKSRTTNTWAEGMQPVTQLVSKNFLESFSTVTIYPDVLLVINNCICGQLFSILFFEAAFYT